MNIQQGEKQGTHHQCRHRTHGCKKCTYKLWEVLGAHRRGPGRPLPGKLGLVGVRVGLVSNRQAQKLTCAVCHRCPGSHLKRQTPIKNHSVHGKRLPCLLCLSKGLRFKSNVFLHLAGISNNTASIKLILPHRAL